MDGDGTVTAEILLAIMVREWTARMLPDEPDLGGRAAGRALECLAAGASVSEAWQEARGYVRSWSLHPSRPRPQHISPLRLAS